ncbi:MAG: hypothetical protein RDU83_00135 [bacterium]|nr:hypothetical protein [bacterium]
MSAGGCSRKINYPLDTLLEVCGWRSFQPEVREAMRTVQRTSGGEEAGGWLEVRLPAPSGARSQLRRTLRDVGRPA